MRHMRYLIEENSFLLNQPIFIYKRFLSLIQKKNLYIHVITMYTWNIHALYTLKWVAEVQRNHHYCRSTTGQTIFKSNIHYAKIKKDAKIYYIHTSITRPYPSIFPYTRNIYNIFIGIIKLYLNDIWKRAFACLAAIPILCVRNAMHIYRKWDFVIKFSSRQRGKWSDRERETPTHAWWLQQKKIFRNIRKRRNGLQLYDNLCSNWMKGKGDATF